MQDKYKILGLDPGTNLFGYAIIEIEGSKAKLITLGALKINSEYDHQDKLKEIFLQVQEIIETYLPRELSIEAPFFGKNVQSMLKLGRAQGVAIAAAITMGLKVNEYSPKKIKQSVTGNGNASKEQVASMLQTLLKFESIPQNLDATDGMAAAVCHFFQNGSNQVSETKSYGSWSSFVSDNPKRVK